MFTWGGEALLVGRSHACDHPPAARRLPVLTTPALAPVGSTAALHAAVAKRLAAGLSLFSVDLDLLRTLGPNVVVTQAQCDVCAVPVSQLEADLQRWTAGRPELVSFTPATLKQVLSAALALARTVGLVEEAMRWMAAAEARLQALRHHLGLARRTPVDGLPTVACIEWLDPLMTAGHWAPDLVEMAGGAPLPGLRGEASRWIEWEELRAADPDVVVVAPCGIDLAGIRRDAGLLDARPGWQDLRAVRTGRVYAIDGNAYFNRPGPRLYRAIELLALVLYPEQAAEVVPPAQPWEMCRWDAL